MGEALRVPLGRMSPMVLSLPVSLPLKLKGKGWASSLTS